MSVSEVQTSTTPILGASARDYSQMTEIDFMNLLVTQIQNQDPLSPMDNAEFTNQITQFTMLEQLTGLGSKMDNQILMAQAINNTAMLALVGRNVTVEGDSVTVDDKVASRSMLNAGGAGTATIEVLDEQGEVVRTYTKDIQAGLNTITWDGKLDDDEVAPDGSYKLRVTVEDAGGTTVPATLLMTGPVESLRYENNIAVVSVFGQDFNVADIYLVC
jgi:flagellar basal-body rod modification protein FlgD